MTIINDKKELLRKKLTDLRITANERFTIGQRELEAEFYVEASTIEELVLVIKAARECEVPSHVLGLGFKSEDETDTISGLVIKNNCRKFAILSMRGKVTTGTTLREEVYVQSETGVGLNQLVRFTIDEALEGLESFLGETGTVGDSLMQHVQYEKYEEYLTSHIFTLRFLTKENEVIEVSAEPFLHPFSMNMIEKNQVIPLSVVFRLLPGDKHELWKKGTQAAFERNQSDLTDPLKGNFNY